MEKGYSDYHLMGCEEETSEIWGDGRTAIAAVLKTVIG